MPPTYYQSMPSRQYPVLPGFNGDLAEQVLCQRLCIAVLLSGIDLKYVLLDIRFPRRAVKAAETDNVEFVFLEATAAESFFGIQEL